MTGEREVCFRCRETLGDAYELGDGERSVRVCRACALVLVPGQVERVERWRRAEATIRHRRHRGH